MDLYILKISDEILMLDRNQPKKLKVVNIFGYWENLFNSSSY